jgi:predicted amidophosphoribosyltransferase
VSFLRTTRAPIESAARSSPKARPAEPPPKQTDECRIVLSAADRAPKPDTCPSCARPVQPHELRCPDCGHDLVGALS